MSVLKAISLFSGCGGFDFGATQAGIDVIWANDIDRVAASAYQSLLPNTEFILSDIQNIQRFPPADILIGCYPCTGFSVAARRRWKSRNDRDLMEIKGNFLYLEFMRVLAQSKPKFFFVENVRGMLSAKNGWFFDAQLKGFEKNGYQAVHKLLYAPDYGAPQSRQRVFIVGIRNDVTKDFTYEFLKPTHGANGGQPYMTQRQAIGDLPQWPEGEFSTNKFHGHFLTRNRKRHWDDLSYTIVANESHVPLHPSGEPMVFMAKDKWALRGDINRRLSWRECARLQGFPDCLEPVGSLEGKYRVIGNAVPPAFGKALLTPIVGSFS
ncbi:MAG: DNA (cytosine-5-)-methyltransferase [Candidatus Adiutrix sp.]|jgi:DNA (cytosine-5)-methyltransferase 1|nr:DNA (cytosine-5-)-methyltransferase [Candidatus Adiutrix sp.]